MYNKASTANNLLQVWDLLEYKWKNIKKRSTFLYLNCRHRVMSTLISFSVWIFPTHQSHMATDQANLKAANNG